MKKKVGLNMIMGANNPDKERQEDDYYATDPKALEVLLEQETFENVWEPACGQGHLAKVLDKKGILGKATDLKDRGYGTGGVNFLDNLDDWNGDIITNPPFNIAEEFVKRALDSVSDGRKVGMFVKIQFLEGQARKKLYAKYPPKTVYVFSGRVTCAMNGDFEKYNVAALAYIWIIWEKGYKGQTELKWIN